MPLNDYPPPSDAYLLSVIIAWAILITALSLDWWKTVHFLCLPLSAYVAWRIGRAGTYWGNLRALFWEDMFPPEVGTKQCGHGDGIFRNPTDDPW